MTPINAASPPVVDHHTWRAALDELRKREKAVTRELDAIAAQLRRLPMVELPDYIRRHPHNRREPGGGFHRPGRPIPPPEHRARPRHRVAG